MYVDIGLEMYFKLTLTTVISFTFTSACSQPFELCVIKCTCAMHNTERLMQLVC